MKIAWSRSIGTLLALMLATSGYSNAEIQDKCSQVESQRVALKIGLEGQASEAKFEREAQRWLQALAKNPSSFHKMLDNVFGGSYDKTLAEELRTHMVAGDFSWMPVVQIVPNEIMPYAAAAYSEKENRVYLNNIILNTPLRAFAYLEEVGHYLDTMLNERDKLGDEGEHFMRLVAGQSHQHSLQPETGTIVVDGRTIEVEFGWLDDVWDAVKKGAGWSWDQVESATDWTLGGAQDTWEWFKENTGLGWLCLAGGVGVSAGCTACVGSIVLAPETGFASLTLTQQTCGFACAGAAALLIDKCIKESGAKTEATPVGTSRRELKMSTVLHKESLVRLYDGGALRVTRDWQAFPIGIWDVHALAYIGNDRASSITIAPGLVARVCTEDGLRGDCFDFHQGQDERNWYWSRTSHRTLNDRTSSLSVTPGVTVYQHSNFNGKSWTYTPGNYKHTDFRNVLNDQISSFITAPGILVRFCAESGGWGDCYTVGGDEKSTVRSRMNDRISNIVVSKGVTVYKDIRFEGRRKPGSIIGIDTFAPGTYDAVTGLKGVENDTVSSMVVPPGLEARLCSDSGGRGKCRTFRGNVSFVGPDMNDLMSWLQVTTVDHSFLRRPIGTLPMTTRHSK
jgi:hypothetical protein